MTHWKPLRTIDGLECYGATLDSGKTLVVSFDHQYPKMKWRASYQGNDRQTHYLDAFDTKEAAMQCVEEAARCA